MAIDKKRIDELLTNCKKPEDILGEFRLLIHSNACGRAAQYHRINISSQPSLIPAIPSR